MALRTSASESERTPPSILGEGKKRTAPPLVEMEDINRAGNTGQGTRNTRTSFLRRTQQMWDYLQKRITGSHRNSNRCKKQTEKREIKTLIEFRILNGNLQYSGKLKHSHPQLKQNEK